MRISIRVLSFSFMMAMAAVAAVPPGDARRGAELFQSQQCVACHSVQGRGGQRAPDLAKTVDRAWSPGLLASLMWNHAPTMWPAMEKAGIPRPQLTQQQAADLYAYLYAFRFFEKPGDAARGKQVFSTKGCSGCHSLTTADSKGPGPPVAQWGALTDSIALARAMWNHSPGMRAATVEKKVAWPTLTSQELTDLVVYLRNIPGVKTGTEQFSAAAPEMGASLFEAKGCAGCHQGSLSFKGRFQGRTLTDFAAAMWNHSSKMIQMQPGLTPEDMRALVGYLWSLQYFDDPGNARRGEHVFESKKCAVCHKDPSSGAPSLAGRSFDSITMVSVLWQHGPSMLERMKQRNIKWPVFRGTELTDLIAYLNTLK